MNANDGAVALITGASRGLGQAIARLYAQNGIRLVLTARGVEPLEETAGELAASTEVLALPGDVTDRAHAERLVREGVNKFGRIDILINNASELGPSPLTTLDEYDLDALDRVLDVNLLAPLHLIQLVLPGMRERGQGIIVDVSSDAAMEAYPTWGGYGASKAALEHLSRVLASELEGTRVRVYAVDPGDMDTEMHRLAEPGEDLSHLPPPEAVAPAFLRLLDEAAPFGRYQAQDLVEAGHARA